MVLVPTAPSAWASRSESAPGNDIDWPKTRSVSADRSGMSRRAVIGVTPVKFTEVPPAVAEVSPENASGVRSSRNVARRKRATHVAYAVSSAACTPPTE
jgi:hypothetical protein